jgi:serpin B
MMCQVATVPYLQTDVFEAIDLAYGDGRFSLTVIVPRDGHDLAEILAVLSVDTWQQWREQATAVELVLFMPRFTVTYDTELRDVLTALGMGIAFSDAADFSRINPSRRIAISRVLHSTVLAVDEAGTTAAGATVVEFRETAILPVVLRLDHPFLFVIGEHHAGAVLFAGILADPSD